MIVSSQDAYPFHLEHKILELEIALLFLRRILLTR
jgi:hypothetical protein